MPKRYGNSRTGPRVNPHANLSAEVGARSEDELFVLLEKVDRPLLLVLDGITDPHNLGACLRSADGAGAHAVVIPKDRSVSMTATVRTVACGAAEHVPLIQVTNLARSLRELRQAGVWLVGTVMDAERTIYECDLTGPTALVMGSEGTGIRRLTRESCDFLASLPMHGRVESLNVSVAAGICLYEAVRQRTHVGR
ncbi:MAG: 23S rRNA (guanosine(2251)-2'-O)-methyltransferase RlmB [candidate division Zixibacteria bacterium]|jgi:23S rRNA (guanosine2251-2'-O)-methyltransferase|nr:23S rRNA (guanosine(2251)-2'-O)-methyltransferase RlmB [candidate division Zixibacteria bacterium]